MKITIKGNAKKIAALAPELQERHCHERTDLKSACFRRFQLKDPSKEESALQLIESKGLTREDVMCLLSTFEIVN